jgi:F1F0 ATPase subunit 2
MTADWRWVLIFSAGVLLGGFFFGGLCWTVRLGMLSQRPALVFMGSLLLRTSVVLGGFYWLGSADWQLLLLCLLGFISARLLILRLIKPLCVADQATQPGVSRAP